MEKLKIIQDKYIITIIMIGSPFSCEIHVQVFFKSAIKAYLYATYFNASNPII